VPRLRVIDHLSTHHESTTISRQWFPTGPWRGVVNGFAGSTLIPPRVRTALYRILGIRLGRGVQVQSGVILRSPNLYVGEGSTINYRCVFDNRAPVHIGSGVGVGICVSFITSSHDMTNHRIRAGKGSLSPIFVGDGAWIGSGAILLPGVNIGAGAVVAAGSVVREDCIAGGLYGGVPARLIRMLDEN
jgi:maltose O-acetyltransferase